MLEFLKKSILIGVGFASLTKDKIREEAKKIATELKLTEEEGRKLADDLVKQSEQSRKKLQQQVEEFVKKALYELHLPSREDIERIENRLKKLEEKNSGSRQEQ